MKLEIDGEVVAENPTAGEIPKTLASLDGDKAEFAILSRDEIAFMQTTGSPENGFSLEYQDGSTKTPYHCSDDLNLEAVIKAFQSYAGNGNEWQKNYHWESEEKFKKRKPPNLKQSKKSSLDMVFSLAPWGGAMLFGFLASKDTVRFRLWVSLFLACIALFFISNQIGILKQGYFWNGWLVTRKKSPFSFWVSVVLGVVGILWFLRFVILFWMGKIG